MGIAILSCLFVLIPLFVYYKGYKKGQEDAQANKACHNICARPSRPVRGNAKIGTNY